MKLCRSLTVFCAGLLLSTPAPAATFTVTSQQDSGSGSLRQAISDAAATAGKDTIEFNVAGAQPEITLLTPLHALDGDTIDGLTQPGDDRVKLRWNFTGGLIPVEGEGAVIQGLQFQSDFPISGPPPSPDAVNALTLGGAGSHLVKACSFSGFQMAIIARSPDNIIGGGTGLRNRFAVYTAFKTDGTGAAPATGSVIRGNEFVSQAVVANVVASTLWIGAFADHTTIESDPSTGAVNTFDGLVNILSAQESANLIFRGNRAGDTAPNGTVFAPSNNGLIVISGCPGAIVENNSLFQSGNLVIGVYGCLNSLVKGNTIRNTGNVFTTNLNTGITASGTAAGGDLNMKITGNVIGGVQEGIRIRHSTNDTVLSGLQVDGNFIGLNQAHTPASEFPVIADPAIFNPCHGGIILEGNIAGMEIGGVANAGTGHTGPNTVIAASAGITLMPFDVFQSSATPQRIRMDRNRIALKTINLPALPPSVSNAGQWIVLTSTYRPNMTNFSSYVIPANDHFDTDTGPNCLINYPVLTTSATEATGTMDGRPNAAYTIQVNACTSDGNVLTGIPVFIGSASVTANVSGYAAWSIPLASPPFAGSVYYAMATDILGNTSHIGSKVFTPLSTVSLVLPAPEVRAVEGTPFPVTVTRSGDLSIASTVRILVGDGNAQFPDINGDTADVSNSDPVTFQPGEASKDVFIPITDDNVMEAPEKIRIDLQAISGTSLGAVTTGLITIAASDLPRVSLGNATVVEGNSGTRLVSLPVTLDRPVQISELRFSIVGGTATKDLDYSTVGLAFGGFLSAAMSSQTEGVVYIALLGDTAYEADETVIVEYDHTTQHFSDGTPIIDDSHPQGTLTIQNDDLPVVRIVPMEVAVPEGDSGTTPANLSIQLVEGPVDLEVRVPWQTVSGTAVAGSDYIAASGEVVLAPGTTSQTISVQVIGDTLVDNWPAADESFTVQLGTPVNAAAAPGQSSASISIQDDDARSITLTDASVTEGNSGTAVMTFTATIPSPTGSPVSFEWITAPETADTSDYTGLSGTLTIPAGQTEASINIEIKGDTLYENNETFSIVTGIATNGILTRERATGTILNDDTAPAMTVTNTVVTEGPEDVDFYAWFQVRLSAASGAPVTFQWSTVAGTATPGVDYIESSNTSVIPPGDRNFWIAVPVLGDNSSDSDETFQLRIPGASGATVPPSGLTGTCTLKETAITNFFPVPQVPGLYALSFWTGRGQSYLIEQSTWLGEDQEWIPVSGIIPGSSAEITQLQYSFAPRAYFRVRATATPPN